MGGLARRDVGIAVRVGVDTGGTFTDLVADDGRVVKLPSTPADPSVAVISAIEALGPRPSALAHGTTVATNALLERSGARVALVTTKGFADVIEIARQRRPSLYDLWADRPEPLVPRELRFEVGGRLGPDGTELEAIDVRAMPSIPDGVEAVAVCLLHSDRCDHHERTVAAAVSRPGLDVVRSSEVSPEFREYERTVTTVVNAYLRPACDRYLRQLEGAAEEVLVLTSAGGLVPVGDAVARPAAILLSGPAGGVRAGATASVAAGFADAVTFDMGGTSTDVCLVMNGRPEPAAQRTVAGFPIRLPALDIHTIGAGGGSIARIDAGGALVVGPRSAGAVPGPAGYGRGGTEPTVTDADLMAGRIPADAGFAGLGRLDVTAAAAAFARTGIDPDGVLAVVDASVVQAIRAVSVERGVDPRGLALVAFGGAGPLHACALAEALDMTAVVVPPRAGVLSAVGLLCSPRRADVVRSWPVPESTEGLDEALARLVLEARALVVGDPSRTAPLTAAVAVEVETALDCRYAGQSHELTISSADAFEAEHLRRNGFARRGAPVEVVALRASAQLPAPLRLEDLPVLRDRRAAARGPCALVEPDCTVWVPAGWGAEVHESGAWILRR